MYVMQLNENPQVSMVMLNDYSIRFNMDQAPHESRYSYLSISLYIYPSSDRID